MIAEQEQEQIVFDADLLINMAMKRTGLKDFGSSPFREGLEVLLETYDKNFTAYIDRRKCRNRVLKMLNTRLRCEEAFKRYPEIEDQTFENPIFITGLPRSGTSALMNVLAQAPENRTPMQWEMQLPDIWPGSKQGDEDPRYTTLKEKLESTRTDSFAKIHFIEADLPEECVMLHALYFSGAQLGFEGALEPYASWMKGQDLEEMYRYQLKLMKMISWRNPGQQWMFKAPSHMWGIDSIAKVFPGAKFVWCHRNPMAVIPSITSMGKVVMDLYAGDSCVHTMKELGTHFMDWYATSLERGLAARAKLPANRFIDCSQQEFVDNPMAMADKIKQQFGLKVTDEGRAAMQAYVDANPKGKHGKHSYDLESYGLTEQIIRDRFAFYYNDNQWPISD